MSMKKSDLDKKLGMSLVGRMKGAAVPNRFGEGAAEATDRREQRRRDAQAGLVPFACKLPRELAARVRERALQHEGGLNGLVAELLDRGLRSAA
jgi:hypothetical protein